MPACGCSAAPPRSPSPAAASTASGIDGMRVKSGPNVRLPRRRRLVRFLRPTLRPTRGHRLPRELTAPHIGTIAAALADGVGGPGLETLLRRVEAKPIHPGNQVVLYTTGEQAFAAMHAAV